MMVFYITNFVPFIRPNLPMLKETELSKLKGQGKQLDPAPFEFYKR